MELRKYLAILKKNWFFILIFAIFGAATAQIIASKLPSGYSKNQLFLITTSEKQSESFSAEGYYAQERARNFTDTAVAILQSPEFLKEASRQEVAISAQKIAPQLIRVTAITPKPEDADFQIDKISSTLNQQLADLTGPNQPLQVKGVGSSSPTSYNAPNKKILIPFGIATGATFALFVTGLKTYFKL